MNPRRFFVGRAIGLIVVLLLVGGFYLFNTYIYSEKQGDGEVSEPYRATLSGEYICLPVDDDGSDEECEYGLLTDAGEIYNIDFFLMSQTQEPLTVGDKIEAHGVIVPIERLDTDQVQNKGVEGRFSVTDSVRVLDDEEEPYACTLDAKMCPDGSYVGRSGKDCTFDACPSDDSTSTQVTAFLGGSGTAMNVTVSPQEVVSDSRCPSDVQCIWAGTVEVRTVLSTQVAHGEHVLTLGEPQVFGEYSVTLVEVAPLKTQEDISDASYVFTYTVSLN